MDLEHGDQENLEGPHGDKGLELPHDDHELLHDDEGRGLLHDEEDLELPHDDKDHELLHHGDDHLDLLHDEDFQHGQDKDLELSFHDGYGDPVLSMFLSYTSLWGRHIDLDENEKEEDPASLLLPKVFSQPQP